MTTTLHKQTTRRKNMPLPARSNNAASGSALFAVSLLLLLALLMTAANALLSASIKAPSCNTIRTNLDTRKGIEPALLARDNHDDCINNSIHTDLNTSITPRRRNVLKTLLLTAASSTIISFPSRPARASWSFDNNNNRRQLELCLVTVLRVLYWAQGVASSLHVQQDTTVDENSKRSAYLQARLGSKAVLTGRVGGGANNQVYTLATFQLRDVLKDLSYYTDNKRTIMDLNQDLLESLATIVEFDGLETTQDPSPRSSLMLSMYNPDKAQFVQRMLSERIIPTCQEIVNQFDSSVKTKCEAYIQSTYPNEVPKNKPVEVMEEIQETTGQA